MDLSGIILLGLAWLESVYNLPLIDLVPKQRTNESTVCYAHTRVQFTASCRKHTQLSNVCSHGCTQCENCESELQFLKVGGVGWEQDRVKKTGSGVLGWLEECNDTL